MQSVVPALRVTDYARSREFYTAGLGFRVDGEHRFAPHLPVFATVSRDGLVLYLTEHTGDCPPGALVHLFVPDVDAWYADLVDRGVPVHEAPNESIEGLRDMTVLDPDGNQIRVCTRLPR